MSPIVSWPVARATLRAKLRSPGPWIVGALFTITGAVQASSRGAGLEPFSGPATVWYIVLTFALGVAILSEEIESGHAQLVLLRPITRAAWYGGRLAGASLALAVLCVIAWLATLSVAVARGGGFDPMRLASLALALVWGCAWLSVLTCLGSFLPRWTNAGALALVTLAAMLLFGIVALARPEWRGMVETTARFLGPQDPMVFSEPNQPRRDLGPALYDLVWIFAPWVAGVAILDRRELARRKS